MRIFRVACHRLPLAVACAAAILAVACDSDEDDADGALASPAAATVAASPSPGADVTVPAGDCPVDEVFCAFARELEATLATDGAAGAIAMARAQAYECPGKVTDPLAGPFPLCDGAAAGETRAGIPVRGLQSEGSIQSPEMARDFLDRWLGNASADASDGDGTGEVRLASVGCPVLDGAPDCSTYVVVFTALGPGEGQLRSLLEIGVEAGDTHAVVAFGSGVASLNRVMLDGGESPIQPPGFEQRVPTFYYPVSPRPD